MADEGFHEIQLNGKQLVFMFMSATVVSVVIFLCGVLVGRGVRQPVAEVAAAGREAVDPTAAVQSISSVSSADDDAPVATQETLTYAERLEAPSPPRETLDETLAAPPVPAVERQVPPPPAARQEPAETRSAASPAGEPSLREPGGGGWIVQVGAYPQATAEVIGRGLAAKGFPAFITARDRGLFAVRVGKFNDRREAETVARRLEREQQFKNPWVTR